MILRKALFASCLVFLALVFGSLALVGIAYAVIAPLVGGAIILGALMLLQYPFMRLAARYIQKRREPDDQ